MATKDFTKRLTKKPQEVVQTIEPVVTVSTTTKKKVGRPKVKTEPTKNINIAVPESILRQVDIAKCKYNNNMTEYINAVIKDDLEKNMEKYKQLYDLLNS